ncbi:MAG: metallophosphoesterase family protein [Fimbriimonadaceae bacterium]|nr:metallophosphoesterase family protein [Fimbriimonadaceae bacterium]
MISTALLLLQQPFDLNDRYRPTPIPDRVILTWADDPATSIAVTWRTSRAVGQGRIQIRPSGAGPSLEADAVQRDARHIDVAMPITEVKDNTPFIARWHTVQVRDLTPKTAYVYRVGDGVNWSEWHGFRTASDRPEPFSFIYFGDAQNDVRSRWSRVVREAYSDLPKASFVLHAGDLINRAERDLEWGEWFEAGGWINARIPQVATPGNHEYYRLINEKGERTGERALSPQWIPQFEYPRNGVPGLEDTNYFIDYQGARIISLNSSEKFAEQTEWLDRVLTENRNRWTLITFHHPMFSTAKGRDNAELRAAWKPVFDRHQVDLVMQGHDHTYGRMNLATGLTMQDDSSGTVYVVSVSGPKMYELGENAAQMRRTAAQTQLYQLVHVDQNKIRYESRTATGELYDAFEILKGADGRKTIVEKLGRRPAGP